MRRMLRYLLLLVLGLPSVTWAQFPTTSILDSGTGSDANPVAGNWSGPLHNGNGQLQRLSNQFANGPGAAGDDGSWWNAGTFGPDTEAYATLPTVSAASSHVAEIFARAQNPGVASSLDGYAVVADMASGGSIIIARIDNDAYTTLTSAAQTWTNGDSFGIEIIGSTIKAYHKTSAGGWTEKLSTTDSTYSSAGNIALLISNNVLRATNFGGGTIGGGSSQNFFYLRRPQ